MTCRRIAGLFAVGWLLMAPVPALAIWIDLTDEQRKEAMAYGVAHRDTWPNEFNREWQVGGKEWVALLRTEFNALAYLARVMTKRKTEATSQMIEQILAQRRGGLDFAVKLSSEDRDYSEKAEAVLLVGERRISPQQREQIRTPIVPPGRRIYEAHMRYKFPLEGIDLKGPVTLVVKGADGREERFPFDLGKMR